MITNTFNVRGLLNSLSKKYGEKCPTGFDIFLIQTLYRKIQFDCYIKDTYRNHVIDMLFDSMECQDYSEEEALRIAQQLSLLENDTDE